MSLMILSKKPEMINDQLCSVALTALKGGLKFQLFEKDKNKTDDRVEIFLSKKYDSNGDDDIKNYFYMDLIPSKEQEYQFAQGLINIRINEEYYYLIAGTDQADYPHLIYDFALNYLREKPNHIISIQDETYYTFEDMNRLENEGGYFNDWCYKKLPWQE